MDLQNIPFQIIAELVLEPLVEVKELHLRNKFETNQNNYQGLGTIRVLHNLEHMEITNTIKI